MAKEEKQEKAAEPEETKPEATPAEEKKEAQTLEAHYPEVELENGEVYLKRKRGKARIRKIVSKKHQAQLYSFDRGKWTQKSALAGAKKTVHDLAWHLRNKWEKVEKSAVET